MTDDSIDMTPGRKHVIDSVIALKDKYAAKVEGVSHLHQVYSEVLGQGPVPEFEDHMSYASWLMDDGAYGMDRSQDETMETYLAETFGEFPADDLAEFLGGREEHMKQVVSLAGEDISEDELPEEDIRGLTERYEELEQLEQRLQGVVIDGLAQLEEDAREEALDDLHEYLETQFSVLGEGIQELGRRLDRNYEAITSVYEAEIRQLAGLEQFYEEVQEYMEADQVWKADMEDVMIDMAESLDEVSATVDTNNTYLQDILERMDELEEAVEDSERTVNHEHTHEVSGTIRHEVSGDVGHDVSGGGGGGDGDGGGGPTINIDAEDIIDELTGGDEEGDGETGNGGPDEGTEEEDGEEPEPDDEGGLDDLLGKAGDTVELVTDPEETFPRRQYGETSLFDRIGEGFMDAVKGYTGYNSVKELYDELTKGKDNEFYVRAKKRTDQPDISELFGGSRSSMTVFDLAKELGINSIEATVPVYRTPTHTIGGPASDGSGAVPEKEKTQIAEATVDLLDDDSFLFETGSHKWYKFDISDVRDAAGDSVDIDPDVGGGGTDGSDDVLSDEVVDDILDSDGGADGGLGDSLAAGSAGSARGAGRAMTDGGHPADDGTAVEWNLYRPEGVTDPAATLMDEPAPYLELELDAPSLGVGSGPVDTATYVRVGEDNLDEAIQGVKDDANRYWNGFWNVPGPEVGLTGRRGGKTGREAMRAASFTPIHDVRELVAGGDDSILPELGLSYLVHRAMSR